MKCCSSCSRRGNKEKRHPSLVCAAPFTLNGFAAVGHSSVWYPNTHGESSVEPLVAWNARRPSNIGVVANNSSLVPGPGFLPPDSTPTITRRGTRLLGCPVTVPANGSFMLGTTVSTILHCVFLSTFEHGSTWLERWQRLKPMTDINSGVGCDRMESLNTMHGRPSYPPDSMC